MGNRHNGNFEHIATAVGQELLRRRQCLSTVESCTGGWIAQAITTIAGSSAWFEAGFVTYSNASKTTMVGVPSSVLDVRGAVSAEAVESMVAGGCRATGTEWGVAVSGIAGPGGGTAAKPVGTVYIAWQGFARPVWSKHFHFSGDRKNIRIQTVEAALQGLLAALQDHL